MDGIWLNIQPRQVLGINRKGRAPAQRHPGTAIEFVSYGIELLLAVAAQIRTLGKVLAQQAVSVLVAAPLPGAVGVTEVDLHACVVGELGMFGHLPAPVIGQALAHGLGDGVELVSEGLQHMRCRGRVGVWQLDQHHQARGALDQGADGAGVVGSLDQVTLPVTWKLAILYLGWAQLDAEQVFDLAAPVPALGAWPALGVRHAQTREQLLFELASGLGIDAGVDALVGHALAPVMRVQCFEVPGNLLGRPVQLELLAHELKQRAIALQLGLGAAVDAALVAALLSKAADVAIAPGVALNLAADGALVSTQRTGNGADGLLLLQTQRYRLTLAFA